MKFIVFFVGGEPTKEEKDEHMLEWKKWIESLGNTSVEYNNGYPYGQKAVIVSSKGTNTYKPSGNDGSGYMLIRAESIDDAAEVMGSAPSIVNGGKIILRELMDKKM